MRGARRCYAAGLASVVEIEVARGTLLEPQTVVVRGVLEELGSLLEHVVVLLGLVGELALDRILDGLTAGMIAGMPGRRRRLVAGRWRSRVRSWNVRSGRLLKLVLSVVWRERHVLRRSVG
jgi:hypothetical protein